MMDRGERVGCFCFSPAQHCGSTGRREEEAAEGSGRQVAGSRVAKSSTGGGGERRVEVHRSTADTAGANEAGKTPNGRGGDGSAAESQEGPKKTHLVVMVHGLGGSAKDWRALVRLVHRDARLPHMMIHASEANSSKQSLEGVYTCGDRLVQEINAVVHRNPGLQYFSIVGHSFGGLLSRYASGKLFDPVSGLVAGLQPKHFISVASPHLGCDMDGNAQLPIFHFMANTPLLGKSLDKTMKSMFASSFSLLGQTGKDLFFQDVEADDGQMAVVEQLTCDVPGGPLFLSALRAYESRTVYANVWGDPLVGWANSSLRFLHELPKQRELKPGQLHFSVSAADTSPMHKLQLSQAMNVAERSYTIWEETEAGGAGLEAGGQPPNANGSWSESLSVEPLHEEAGLAGEWRAKSEENDGDSVGTSFGHYRSFNSRHVGSHPLMEEELEGSLSCSDCESSSGKFDGCELDGQRPSRSVTPVESSYARGIASDGLAREESAGGKEEDETAASCHRSEYVRGESDSCGLGGRRSPRATTPSGKEDVDGMESTALAPERRDVVERADDKFRGKAQLEPHSIPADAGFEAGDGVSPKGRPMQRKKSRVNSYANETVDRMLLRLQALHWNRVDVTFKTGAHAFNSHNHIKEAKRGVVSHVVDLLAEFEQRSAKLCPYSSTTIQMSGQ